MKGFRGSDLVYVPSEKCLYVYKRTRDGAKYFICYQTVLSKPTKRPPARKEDRCDCKGSIKLNPDGSLNVMSNHVTHNNHDSIMKDMQKAENIKKSCRTLRDEYAEDAHRIPAKHIFQREISKYISFLFICLSVRPFIQNLIYRNGFRNTQLDYDRMKRTLIRHKNKKYPIAPRSVEGIRQTFMEPDIFEEYGRNKERDADFYIGTVCHVGDEEDENDKDYAFTVFASKYVIDFIKKMPPHQRLYLMDGTFDSLPSEYYRHG